MGGLRECGRVPLYNMWYGATPADSELVTSPFASFEPSCRGALYGAALRCVATVACKIMSCCAFD